MRLARPLAAAGLVAGAVFATAAPASAIGVSPACPSGSQGVVITYDDSSTYVCTTALYDLKRIVAQLFCDCPITLELPPISS